MVHSDRELVQLQQTHWDRVADRKANAVRDGVAADSVGGYSVRQLREEHGIMTTAVKTREAWLLDAIEALRPRFDKLGMPLPAKIRVSVGYTRRPRGHSVGWCWADRADSDNHNVIFISPELAAPVNILPVLLHELIHAADNCKSKHRGAFAKAHKALGFIGKATQAVPSEDLAADLYALGETLGPFPHAAFRPGQGTTKSPSTQSTYLRKVECPSCGYTIRVTAKWISQGLPTCPCGSTMEEV